MTCLPCIRRPARSGQVVVARIDNEVTVKRLKRKGNAIELLPENDAMAPIPVILPSVILRLKAWL